MKIAIIGSGISGMGAAYMLHKEGYEITLYEKENYIGGHSRTLEVKTDDGVIPVDTGFIVFNYRNYPHLTKLFEELKVPIAKSDMSFAASIDDGYLEYGTQSLKNIFAQKKNLLRPKFWGMMRDIFKFNKKAKAYVEANPEANMEEALKALKMGEWFKQYYLLAMGGAIWSTPLEKMLAFPAKTMVQFFENHGLLTVNDQPQWYTVKGGSREYVKRLTANFADKIKLNCGIKEVIRQDENVLITDETGGQAEYDEVIFACHSDQALELINKPSQAEKEILGATKYQPNKVILHSDESFLPKRKNAWASWVYLSEGREDKQSAVSLSYLMNKLQPLATNQSIIVTLNPTHPPKQELIYNEHILHHPVFDMPAIKAQERIDEIQGVDRLWFCGAWQKYGFHEDGLKSAVEMVEKIINCK